MTPRGVACMDPRGTVGRIYKEDHYTTVMYVISCRFFGTSVDYIKMAATESGRS